MENVDGMHLHMFFTILNTLLVSQLPKNLRFRLPTEAEWEFAARGRIHNGFLYSGSNNLFEVAWHDGNSKGSTHPVKQKKPNELGLYDMSGNVWEICADNYGPYSSDTQTNPTGLEAGEQKVLRGGCYHCGPVSCRVAMRSKADIPWARLPLSNDNSATGFRLAMS